jgi:hypothetical protein
MARYPGADAIYEVANEFRERCLTTGNSLLWPTDTVWTAQNLSALWDAFVGHPDTGKRAFLDKWKGQLSGGFAEVYLTSLKTTTSIIVAKRGELSILGR